MRRILLAALLLAFAGTAKAQGLIVPRCPEIACPSGSLCPVPPPCDWGSGGVSRTRNDVRVVLRDGVLSYEVSEVFTNHGGTVGEADYVFPLPRKAAFRDLRLMINGELVSGETMSAERARGIYEEIVRRQRDPALVEWFGHGLLRARIFPIAPGERKQVVVRFDAVAEREGDAVRVDYFRGSAPAREGPRPLPAVRRRPGNGDDEWASTRAPASRFQLRYRADAALGRAYSPTHTLRERREGDWRIVEASGDGSEMTLLVPLVGRDRPAVSVLTHASSDDRYALISLSPPARRGAPIRRDVAFVVDVSGSMRGEKMTQAIAAGEALLRTLLPEDHFRIIPFSTDVDRFRDGSVPATRANVAAAVRYLRDLDAGGSTNIEGALLEALDQEPRGLPIVLFLTDGQPTVGERRHEVLARMAADRRGRARIFTFGIGADVNVTLLEGLAMEGRGTVQFIRPDESLEHAVAVTASRLGEPLITDLRLRANGVRLRHVYPELPADVFAGQDLVILARYEGQGRADLELTGSSSSGPVRFAISTNFPSRLRDNQFVARLWAIRRIGYLTAERRRAGASRELDAEIRELGERFGIPTELSSYLVLEPGMDAAVASAPVAPATAFESGREAATLRTTGSLAAIERIGAPSAAGTRRVGARLFALDGDVWKDTRPRPRGARTVRVQPYSDLYFALVRAIPDLRDIFAMGERVVVHGSRITIEVHPTGATRLAPDEIEEITRAW